jgi:tetratricopeptide (TPR) repeat protein
MPAPTQRFSAAELTSLEHAFAADPTSESYRPLAEAYLALGRYMEAMVVCKKGVKAHPEDPSPRLLLSRVYADQGKDRKALEELQAVLQAWPAFAAANRMAGALHLRLGERDAGIAALHRALEAAPGDAETIAMLAKNGIAVAAPAPVAPRAAAPSVAPRTGVPVAPRTTGAAMPSAAGVAIARAAAPRAFELEQPVPTPPPVKTASSAYADALAEKYATREFSLESLEKGRGVKKKSKSTAIVTVALAAVVVSGLGGWAVFTHQRKTKIETIDKLIKEAQGLLERDAWPAYKEAAVKSAEVVELDDKVLSGHAYLAWVDAVRWAEHAEGDPVRDEAQKAHAAGKALGKHSHLVAAEAFLRYFSNDTAGGIEVLQGVLGGDEGSQSPFLMGVLGALQLAGGDLDAARDTLTKAQKANPGDARLAQLLAEQFRRRGIGYELQASGMFDLALRIQKDHVPSLLGKSLLLLDRGQLDEAVKGAERTLDPRIESSPRQRALALMIRASVRHAQGKGVEAAADEAEAARLDPRGSELPFLLGRRKLRDGDAAGAVEAFKRAIALDGKRVTFYVDLVQALLAQEGGAKKAVDLLQGAVAKLGDHPRLALLLGQAYMAQGDADRAQGQFERSIQLGRPFPDARVALAKLRLSQKNVGQALAELDLAIREYGAGGAGGAARAYVEMAEAEKSRNAKRDLVAGYYDEALKRDPVNCDALWGAAKLQLDADKKLDEANRGRLDAYAKSCPRGPHAAEAEKLAASGK